MIDHEVAFGMMIDPPSGGPPKRAKFSARKAITGVTVTPRRGNKQVGPLHRVQKGDTVIMTIADGKGCVVSAPVYDTDSSGALPKLGLGCVDPDMFTMLPPGPTVDDRLTNVSIVWANKSATLRNTSLFTLTNPDEREIAIGAAVEAGAGTGRGHHRDGDEGKAAPTPLRSVLGNRTVAQLRAAACTKAGVSTFDPQGYRYRTATLQRATRFLADLPPAVLLAVLTAFLKTGILEHESVVLPPMVTGDPFTQEVCFAAEHSELERRASYDLFLVVTLPSGAVALIIPTCAGSAPFVQCLYDDLRARVVAAMAATGGWAGWARLSVLERCRALSPDVPRIEVGSALTMGPPAERQFGTGSYHDDGRVAGLSLMTEYHAVPGPTRMLERAANPTGGPLPAHQTFYPSTERVNRAAQDAERAARKPHRASVATAAAAAAGGPTDNGAPVATAAANKTLTSVKAKAPAKIEAVANSPIRVVSDRAYDKNSLPKISACLHVRQYTGLGPVRFWAVLAANDRGQHNPPAETTHGPTLKIRKGTRLSKKCANAKLHVPGQKEAKGSKGGRMFGLRSYVCCPISGDSWTCVGCRLGISSEALHGLLANQLETANPGDPFELTR